MADTTTGTSVAIATPDLEIIEGQITTTSQQIAEHFGKRHADVIRAIRKLECPGDFAERNFALTTIETKITGAGNAAGSVRKDPAYRITRDGFTLLAMGFTGKEAMQWKVAYLTAFNKMEQELLAQTTRPSNPAIDYDRISPAQAQDLKELVHAIAESKVQGFGETWARLHRKFRVNSYLELPATKFDEARDYLLGKLPEAQHKPVSDSERIALAHSVAAEVAAQASRTVFQALLASGTSDWQHERWMFSMGYDRDSRKVLPWAAAIDRDALVASLPRLAQMISEPNGILPSDAELANLASACTQRLAQRAASRARSASIA